MRLEILSLWLKLIRETWVVQYNHIPFCELHLTQIVNSSTQRTEVFCILINYATSDDNKIFKEHNSLKIKLRTTRMNTSPIKGNLYKVNSYQV